MELAPEPMNGTDAALWEIERDPTLRTTVVSILTLDREIAPKRLFSTFEAASRLVPRLRQRVEEQPLGIGVPHWVLAETFDLREHVSIEDPADGSRSGREAVLDAAAAAGMAPFERTKPLWECHYIGGLDPTEGFGRAALIIKVHHSLADGVGGVALLDALLDATRTAPVRDLSTLPEFIAVAAPHASGPPVADRLRSIAALPTRAGRLALDSTLHPLRSAAATVAASSSAFRLLAPSGDILSPLMTGRSPDRRFGLHEVDLDRLHDAAAAHGCSVNHLFFAGVLGGAAAYHRDHDTELHELRVTMPVSFRRSGAPAGGNQWAPVRFRVPTDIVDPVDRMLAIRAITTKSRDEPALGFSHTIAGAVQMLPGAVSSGIVSAMMRGVDIVLTNVPGLSEPRYLAGARVERMYPFAPLAGSAFNVGLLSHGTTACFGFNADTSAIADTDVLYGHLAAHIDEAIAAAEAAPRSTVVPTPPTPRGPERLSALDESFLQLETESTPMHLGGLFVLDGTTLRGDDGELRIDDIGRHVEARLSAAPRYLKRLADVPLRQGRPLWVDDPEFDITQHVRTIALEPPGTNQQLRALVADLNCERLERDRPLWELWIIDGLDDGRVALLQKVHHSLVDGIASVELAAALFDAEPRSEPDRPGYRPTSNPPSAVRAVADAWVEQLRDPIDLARRMTTSLTAAPGNVVAQTQSVVQGVFDMIGARALAPKSPLNQPVGPQRELAELGLPFDRIGHVRTAHGGTANDVALTVLAGGLRAWLLEHGHPLPDLHAFCPVSTHGPDTDPAAGNHVGAMLIPLPLGEPDAVRRLAIIRERTNRAKRRHDGEGVALALDAFDHLPHVAGIALRQALAHQPFVNLVVTNVPGPPQPLWFLDAPVQSIVPIVPLGPNTALGVAVLSYDGVLTIGLHADPEHVPDLERMAAAVLDDFERLSAS